jgi:hypothetical protein
VPYGTQLPVGFGEDGYEQFYSDFDFFAFTNDRLGGHNSDTMPTTAVEVLFGLTSIQADEFTSRAVEYNDHQGKSFKFIAGRMERFFGACDALNKQHGLRVVT